MLGSPCGSPSYQGCVRQGKIGVRDWVGIYLKVTETLLSEFRVSIIIILNFAPHRSFCQFSWGGAQCFQIELLKL